MYMKKLNKSGGRFVCFAAVICLTAASLLFVAKYYPAVASTEPAAAGSDNHKAFAPAATFPGTGVGAIPDATACGPTPGTPLNVTFNVSGIATAPGSVSVDMTFGSPNHTWMGDIIATLIAPNGTSFTVFGVTTSTTATGIGDSSDLGGTYNFSNTAPSPPSGGWWQEANLQTSSGVMTSGTYRTTGLGGAGQVNPAPPTDINAAFAAIPTSNGTWTLRFTDGCTGDTGNVTAANLTLTGPAAPVQHAFDFNGDGKTDFAVARNIGPGPSGTTAQIRWFIQQNGTGTVTGSDWGDATTDFITPADFDGDGKTDIAVWRQGPATVAKFYILQSQTNTLRVDTFGQTGDDPAIIGDYDGDGKADPAVYRCPAFGGPAGQCYFFYRGSNANPNGNITYVPWGFGNVGDFFPNPGDFDGDGKFDFCIQRTNPSVPGQGQFVLLKSGGGVEYINWGLDTDFIIPGDYDGDGKTDFCVRRTVSGLRQHFILTRTGATSQVQFGITGDVSVPGDYDGDGKTDFAIWRGSATPGASTFWVLNSGNNSVQQINWGTCPAGNCDVPVADAYVH